MSSTNILNIDTRIRKQFEIEITQLPQQRKKLDDLTQSLESTILAGRLRKNIESECLRLSKHIDKVSSREEFNFYLANSIHLIERYKIILRVPIKMSFMGRPAKENKVKKSLINEYLDVARKYIDINIDKTKSHNVTCSNCNNKKDFDIITKNTYVCMKCFAQQTIMKHNSSYNDIDRVNISSKYMYDRKVHFRDCVKQYQGKQNCTISPKVYSDLEDQFNRHHLLQGNPDSSNDIRFKNITKNHILMFLKELGHSNHYENVHLIHYTFTGVKPDDISHLESKLLDDFDSLTELYDSKFKHINRKNFINTQYVLYQLLLRHKHPCKKEEFIILKTIDRKLFHDEVCQHLFNHLGWNSTPFY
jgi:hypothetical protein